MLTNPQSTGFGYNQSCLHRNVKVNTAAIIAASYCTTLLPWPRMRTSTGSDRDAGAICTGSVGWDSSENFTIAAEPGSGRDLFYKC